MPNIQQRKRAYSFILLACLAVALVCLLYPIYVIQPFRAQGARELAVALRVLGFRPIVTVICAACAILAAALFWAHSGRTGRVLTVAGALVVCLAAGLSRVNVYEVMFHRVDAPAFEPVAESRLDADEKILAVQLAGTARAYPVRALAYHHVVNDSVDGVPIVATY